MLSIAPVSCRFAESSLLPHPLLSFELARAAPTINRRHERQVLLPEAKRQLLLRLLAVSTFIGKRRIARLPPDEV
jgi:hypothetical protein